MTVRQQMELSVIKEQLVKIYWELVDNKEMREANRLDTIIGKIETLKNVGKA